MHEGLNGSSSGSDWFEVNVSKCPAIFLSSVGPYRLRAGLLSRCHFHYLCKKEFCAAHNFHQTSLFLRLKLFFCNEKRFFQKFLRSEKCYFYNTYDIFRL